MIMTIDHENLVFLYPGGEQRMPAEGNQHPDCDQGGHSLLVALHSHHEEERLCSGVHCLHVLHVLHGCFHDY